MARNRTRLRKHQKQTRLAQRQAAFKRRMSRISAGMDPSDRILFKVTKNFGLRSIRLSTFNSRLKQAKQKGLLSNNQGGLNF